MNTQSSIGRFIMNNQQNIVQMILLVFAVAVAAPIIVEANVNDCSMVISGEATAVSFLTKIKEGQEVPVDAVLMKPDGKGPFPGIVILPGEGGVHTPRCAKGILRLFAEWGYVSLFIDSASSNRPSRYLGKAVFEDQAQDAHKGKEFLATFPYVKAGKVGVIGWWLGGAAVIDAISRSKKSFQMDKKEPFSAAIAIYPLCFEKITELETPLHIFIGKKDIRASATSCRNMQVTVKGDVDYRLTVYSNTGHWYDLPWLSVTYDEAATHDTYEKMREFFAKYLLK